MVISRLPRSVEMDKQTFLKLWDMSADASTQHLFLRLDHEEYSAEPSTPESIYKFYPSVSILF
jgi:hypothetical protein